MEGKAKEEQQGPRGAIQRIYDFAWTMVNPSRSRRIGEEIKRYAETAKPDSLPPLCWVHACSAGEVRVALRMIYALQPLLGGWRFVLTTSTPEGKVIACAAHAGADLVADFPGDSAQAMRETYELLQPACLLLVEAEIWPNQLALARERDVPVFLVNARMTAGEFRRYGLVKAFMRPAFGAITTAFAQSEEYAQRLRTMGVGEVLTTGEIKRDPPATPLDAPANFLSALTASKIMIVAASTHAGEEKLVLRWAAARGTQDTLLVLAPRHTRRAGAVKRAAERLGFRTVLRSDPAPRPDWQVMVVDTFGELPLLLRQATVCFVGKSICARGGQNPWEALQAGCPVVMGPHMQNFADPAKEIAKAGAGIQVGSAGDLSGALSQMVDDRALRATMAAAAIRLLEDQARIGPHVAEQIARRLRAAGAPVYPDRLPC